MTHALNIFLDMVAIAGGLLFIGGAAALLAVGGLCVVGGLRRTPGGE